MGRSYGRAGHRRDGSQAAGLRGHLPRTLRGAARHYRRWQGPRLAVDASGAFRETKRQVGLLRMVQAGVILSNYATLMVEILKDNAQPEAGAVYGAIDMPWAKLVGRSRRPTANRQLPVGLWSDPVAVIDLYRARSMCRWCKEPMTTVRARTNADQHVSLVRWLHT